MAGDEDTPSRRADDHPLVTRKGLAWGIAALAGTIGIVAGFWKGHDWLARHLDVHVVTEVEAGELRQEVKAAADQAKAAAESATMASDRLTAYIEQQQAKEERLALKVERDALKGREGELQDTLLFESQNGPNEISRRRKAELADQIAEIKERIRCMENPDAGGC